MTNQNVAVSESPISPNLPTTSPARRFLISSLRKPLKRPHPQDSAKINSWVDSMRSSSPTRLNSDPNYSSWKMRHPSALDMFEKMTSASKGKQIVMFLDYDGTLSPIVEDPDRAFMSDEMREAVREVAKLFPTAIVTGRCNDKVRSFVKLNELYYAGSHGMDIKGPTRHTQLNGKRAVKFQAAAEFLPMIDEVHKKLIERTRPIPGATVENNKFCTSVHFRRVDEKKWAELAELVRGVVSEYPKLRLSQGRKVLEIRPTTKWDKGKALEFLLDSLGFADRDRVFPIYIGDDRTDEDAFKALRALGQGVGILVSSVPKETNASYTLKDPSEVKIFLQKLVEWRRRSLRRN